jgi:putative ATP-dependent endonuclease of OLD family
VAALDSDDIDDLERYLDATRGALLFARKVMLVEGSAELYLIPPLLRAVKNVRLDEIGVSVVPIFGTHFEVFVKLFGPNGLPKPCAVVADGDAANDDVLQDTRAPAVERVKPLESDHVQVFACETTFERAITMRGTLPMLIAAARELGSTRGARKLEGLSSQIEQTDDVLRVARLHGKGRFAQVASKHVAKASAVPKYIRSAVQWLQTWTT